MAGERLLEVGFYLLAGTCLALSLGLGPEAPPGYDPEIRPQDAFRVVSWNVGGSASGGHALPRDAESAVVEALNLLRPNLVFLQEVSGRRQLQRLVERLSTGDWHWGISRRGPSRVAVLARGGSLSWQAWPGKERMLAAVHHPEGHPDPLMCVVVHADAFSAAARNRSVGAGLDLLEAGRQFPRILAGDFNIDLDLDKRRDLFTDDDHLDVQTYNYAATKLVDVGLGTGATAEPDRRLDYIFVSGEHFEVLGAGPWRGRRTADMDHDPLVADLKWK